LPVVALAPVEPGRKAHPEQAKGLLFIGMLHLS